jgi:predicted peroxiredoxin
MCWQSNRRRFLFERLALLIWAAAPARPELCVTPLVHALVARALDSEVEIHFAGPAVRLLVSGVADQLYPTPEGDKSVGDFMREASAAGVSFYACSMASAAWIGGDERLIPECSGRAGATAVVVRALDPEWRTLIF